MSFQVDPPRQTEIQDFDVTIGPEHDVLRIDVTMNNASEWAAASARAICCPDLRKLSWLPWGHVHPSSFSSEGWRASTSARRSEHLRWPAISSKDKPSKTFIFHDCAKLRANLREFGEQGFNIVQSFADQFRCAAVLPEVPSRPAGAGDGHGGSAASSSYAASRRKAFLSL